MGRRSIWNACASMDLAQFTAKVSLQWHNLICRFKKRPEPTPKQKADLLGHEGEKLAARFLKKSGYKILYRNFRPHVGGEVDLVCRTLKQPELVFVEVKTRSNEEYGAPHQAVDTEKRKGLVLAAKEWLDLLNRPEVIARFDIVEVIARWNHWEIRHLPNAFLAAETPHPGSIPVNPAASPTGAHPKGGCVNVARFPRHVPHY